jgi:hypothetical protein
MSPFCPIAARVPLRIFSSRTSVTTRLMRMITAISPLCDTTSWQPSRYLISAPIYSLNKPIHQPDNPQLCHSSLTNIPATACAAWRNVSGQGRDLAIRTYLGATCQCSICIEYSVRGCGPFQGRDAHLVTTWCPYSKAVNRRLS